MRTSSFCNWTMILSELLLFFCLTTLPKVTFAYNLTDTTTNAILPVRGDSIINVENLGIRRDSSRIRQVIAIKIATSKHIQSYNTLYIEGIPLKSLKPWKYNDYEKIIYFRLNDSVQTILLKFLGNSPFEKSTLAVYFGVGNSSRNLSNIHFPIYVEVRQKISHIWILVAGAILLILAGAGLQHHILKDDNNLYYSLGRTQLFYWTVLVLIAYLAIGFTTDAIPDLPLSVLAILGISVSTTAVAKLIENKIKSDVPIDKTAKSEGFFLDILSDGTSINIQRFQNVAFNLFFGVIFLQKAFSNHILPDFDQNVLILMGISSGAYAALKNSEAVKEQNELPKQTGDDGGSASPVAALSTAE